jgi:hypothetical protein
MAPTHGAVELAEGAYKAMNQLFSREEHELEQRHTAAIAAL